MKRPVAILMLVLLMLVVSAARTFAQAESTPPPDAPPAPVSDSQMAEQILKTAQKASDEAKSANANANNVVNNANNAVNTVNLLLNFVQAASLFGGVLASVFAILGARVGSRTLSDYREELTKAYNELKEFRSGLNTETEQARIQADKAIRALALMQLGEQQLERRNIKGALQLYKQAFDLDPDNRAANYFLGELYVQDKQLDKGIEHLQRSLAADYDYAPAEAALGYALRLQADRANDPLKRDEGYAKAEGCFLKALQVDPMALDIHGESIQAVLGGLYKRQGRIDKAIYRYEEARKVTPDKSYPVGNLANLYFSRGNLDKALPDFEQTLRMSSLSLDMNPQDYWARLDRVTALLVLSRADEAKADLEIVLQQVTTTSPLETALAELTRMKNAPQPLRDADEVLALLDAAIKRMKGQS